MWELLTTQSKCKIKTVQFVDWQLEKCYSCAKNRLNNNAKTLKMWGEKTEAEKNAVSSPLQTTLFSKSEPKSQRCPAPLSVNKLINGNFREFCGTANLVTNRILMQHPVYLH